MKNIKNFKTFLIKENFTLKDLGDFFLSFNDDEIFDNDQVEISTDNNDWLLITNEHEVAELIEGDILPTEFFIKVHCRTDVTGKNVGINHVSSSKIKYYLDKVVIPFEEKVANYDLLCYVEEMNVDENYIKFYFVFHKYGH